MYTCTDFFCDTGNPRLSSDTSNTFHSNHPLWDGVGCTADNECCPTDNPPYFLKTLPVHTEHVITSMALHIYSLTPW